MSGKLPLNCILSFCRDRIPEHGEDSYCYAFCDSAGLLAVFDGCGGAGARNHSCYSGHTEAYMASRLCAGAVYDIFCREFPTRMESNVFAQEYLLPGMLTALQTYAPAEEETAFKVKGSLMRTLPTTAAMAVVRAVDAATAQVSAIWAGDSRVYLLDGQGLAQLTVDDTTVPDPMENLYDDGVLKNLICKGKPVQLHCASVEVKLPFMVLAATDGCFGYVSTPMEFEGLLLKTLLHSSGTAQWEASMADKISQIAGDDHTLCLAAYGYKSFEHLRASVMERYEGMKKEYLRPLADAPVEDREVRRQYWQRYAPDYFRYVRGGDQ